MAFQWRAVPVIAGGVLVHLTLGTIFSFGNLSPYLTSYIRKHSSPTDLSYATSVWINAMTAMGQGTTMFFGGLAERKLGTRLTVILGAWFQSLGIALTFFAVKHSFGLTMLTYGCMFGFGIGWAYAVPLAVGMRWLPHRKGLVNGIVVAGFGGGSFIFVQVQTAYINPDNIAPNVTVDGNKYFSQDEVLDRVPTVFLVLAGSYAAMQLIGVLLLTNPAGFQYGKKKITEPTKPDSYKPFEKSGENISQKTGQDNLGMEMDGLTHKLSEENDGLKDKVQNSFSSIPSSEKLGVEGPKDVNPCAQKGDQSAHSFSDYSGHHDVSDENTSGQGERIRDVNGVDVNLTVSCSTENDSFRISGNKVASGDASGEEKTLNGLAVVIEGPAEERAVTVKQALREPDFYKLWFIFLLNGQGINFVSGLYKAYGQTFLSDDSFLAWVGTFAAVCNASGRIMWGYLADRFSFRKAMLALCCLFTTLMLTLGLTHYGGRWMFFFWVGLLFLAFSGSFALLPTATAKTFGQTYYPMIYGLVFSSQMVTAPVSAALTSSLLSAMGWWGMFGLVAGFSFLSFLLTLSFRAKDKDGRQV